MKPVMMLQTVVSYTKLHYPETIAGKGFQLIMILPVKNIYYDDEVSALM